MHYAICTYHAFFLRPNMVPGQNRCIMRFMQYHCMHYENIDCIRPVLLAGLDEQKSIHAELYKLNVYGKHHSS